MPKLLTQICMHKNVITGKKNTVKIALYKPLISVQDYDPLS